MSFGPAVPRVRVRRCGVIHCAFRAQHGGKNERDRDEHSQKEVSAIDATAPVVGERARSSAACRHRLRRATAGPNDISLGRGLAQKIFEGSDAASFHDAANERRAIAATTLRRNP